MRGRGSVNSDEFIREVDEAVRQEQWLKLWKQYGSYMVAAALAVVVGSAAAMGWRTWQENQRLDDARRYAAAQQLLREDKAKEAAEAFAAPASRVHRRGRRSCPQGTVAEAVETIRQLHGGRSLGSCGRQRRGDGLAHLAGEPAARRRPALRRRAAVAARGQGEGSCRGVCRARRGWARRLSRARPAARR